MNLGEPHFPRFQWSVEPGPREHWQLPAVSEIAEVRRAVVQFVDQELTLARGITFM
jgi:hypothetical protein